MAILLAHVGDDYCNFVIFPCGILGQVWFLIASFPDLCFLCYLSHKVKIFLSYPHTNNRWVFLPTIIFIFKKRLPESPEYAEM